jgi:anti-sigma regulatory factor (Ser/Thr protein kinase)
MQPHIAVPISDPSQVGEARRIALRLGTDLGFDETTCGRLALVVTELGNNLAQHAKDGRLLLAGVTSEGRPQVEVLSVDHGPGMADFERCRRDGFSTGGTPGTGLGAIQRQSDRFSVFSEEARGTVIVAGVAARITGGTPPAAASRFSWAAVGLAAPHEAISGDGWSVQLAGDRLQALMVDGLGHGIEAARVADAAVAAFDAKADTTPAVAVGRLDGALRGSRGAALAVVALDAAAGRLAFCGAGNIAGRIISGTADRAMLSQHGTAGVQIRRAQDVEYPWPEHAIVILHSDGVATRWVLPESGALLRCDLAVIAAWLLRDHSRGHDDATVLVIART